MKNFKLNRFTPSNFTSLKKRFTYWGICKCFLTILFFAIMLTSNATNYYVSSTGNDGNSGTSESTAWLSLAKVNSTTLQPGDQVLFKRGDSFIGSIIVKNSGTAGSPIVYGAYGSGSKPKIYGSEEITGWTKHSGNIYKASFKSDINQLFINGERVRIARYPNSGFLYISGVNSSTKFTSSGLNLGIDYTGATWVGRTSSYTLQTKKVTGSDNQSLTIEEVPYLGLGVDEGFYLMDKLEFLNYPGEWYFDINTSTVYLWTPDGDTPNNYKIRGSSIDNGVKIINENYVTINNLEILHSAADGIFVSNGDNLFIDDNDIVSPAINGIHCPNSNSVNSEITNNTIFQANYNGIRYFSPGVSITDNIINGTLLYENINKSANLGDNAGTGIFTWGTEITVSYNRILNSGYCGINFTGTNNSINNNYINGACTILDDGAGIYTYNGYDYSAAGSAGSVIKENIVLNAYGNAEGSMKEHSLGYGIYMDYGIHNVDILDNTVAGTTCGLFINPCGFINADGNIIMDATLLLHIDNEFDNSTLSNNIFYATDRKGHYIWWGENAIQRFVYQSSQATALFSNNKYIDHYETSDVFPNKTNFAAWQASTGQDLNSRCDISQFNDGETEELFYNDTKQTKSINLGNSIYESIDGTQISGTITLSPFTSIILIRTGSISSTNNNPTISNSTIEISGDIQIDDFIGRVIASDADQDQLLRFSIVHGNEDVLFTIDSETGNIYANTNIQLSSNTTFILQVEVTDNALIPLSATGIVIINIKGDEDVVRIDVTPPIISMFSIPTSTKSLTIPISLFKATDNIGVVGYKITEELDIPLAGDSGWLQSSQETFTFTDFGFKTLYAWVKDAAGNISKSMNASITILEITPIIDSVEYITICEGEEYIGNGVSGEYVRVVQLTSDSINENLIQNNNFYKGLENWTKWGTADYDMRLTLNSDDYVTAPSSLQLDCIKTGDEIFSLALIGPNLSIEAGEEYELTFDAKASEVFSIGKFVIQKRNSPWTQYGSYDNNKPTITKTWNSYKMIFTATHTADDASFQVYLGNSLPVGQTLYLDNISFVKNRTETTSTNAKIITFLTVRKAYNTTEDVTISEGENYMNWDKTGDYERTLSSISGCDSVVTTYLTVLGTITSEEDVFICEGSSYLNWASEGVYQRVFESVSGADSIIVTNLWINPVYHVSESVSIFSGEEYNGWTKTGEYERTLTSISGCDSIVTTKLNMISPLDNDEYVTICEGDSYNDWTTSGTYQRTEVNSQDSILLKSQNLITNNQFTEGYESWFKWGASGYDYNLSLNSQDYISAPVSLQLDCTLNGTNTYSLALLGQNISIEAGKEYELTFYAKATIEFPIGCLVIQKRDSPWTQYGSYDNDKPNITKTWKQHKVKFTATHTEHDASFQIYLGNSFPDGQSLLIDDFTFKELSENTLSTITTYLSVNSTQYSSEEVILSKGENYLGWTESGKYERNLSSSTGCDSIVTTYLTVLDTITTEEDIYICEGSSYMDWASAGQYQRVLQSISGIDSVVVTNLWINPVYYITESVSIPLGEEYYGWAQSGEYERTLTSTAGCDSVVVTQLNIVETSNHFFTLWENENGQNHMNFNIADAYLDGFQLQADDEIAIFDGVLCVGAAKLATVIDPYDVNSYLTIVASQNDGSGNGYTEGNKISFKIWDASEQVESSVIDITYRNDISSWITSGNFIIGGTSVVEIGLSQDVEILTQSIRLKKGWNIFSSYLIPSNPNMESIQSELYAADQLIKVQDEVGNTYEEWSVLNNWINNIGQIDETEGYKIKVNSSCVLNITGTPIDLPLHIDIKTGWNLISFPLNTTVNAMDVISPLVDAGILEKIQDEQGNSIESWGSLGWVNKIGNFKAGKGYKVKVNTNGNLPMYQSYLKSSILEDTEEQTVYFKPNYEGNGSDHMNINIVSLNETGLQVGDEIAAFDGEICVGAVKLISSHFSNDVVSVISSVCDDNLSNGFIEGNSIELKVWTAETNDEDTLDVTVLEGEMNFHRLASVFIQLNYLKSQNVQELDIQVYPNPASNYITVQFSELPREGTKIILTDITGRKVESRVATSTLEVVDIHRHKAGIYLVKTIYGNICKVNKLIIQ